MLHSITGILKEQQNCIYRVIGEQRYIQYTYTWIYNREHVCLHLINTIIPNVIFHEQTDEQHTPKENVQPSI